LILKIQLHNPKNKFTYSPEEGQHKFGNQSHFSPTAKQVAKDAKYQEDENSLDELLDLFISPPKQKPSKPDSIVPIYNPSSNIVFSPEKINESNNAFFKNFGLSSSLSFEPKNDSTVNTNTKSNINNNNNSNNNSSKYNNNYNNNSNNSSNKSNNSNNFFKNDINNQQIDSNLNVRNNSQTSKIDYNQRKVEVKEQQSFDEIKSNVNSSSGKNR
jgi:hypothetical protein